MIIKFQIVKSLIRENVQNTTYLKGQFDRTTQKADSPAISNETIGDEAFHERSFTFDFDTALEKLKTIFVDYIVPTPQTIGDNIIYYGNKTDDIVEFVLQVSRRYNGTLTDALARLSAKYIEDYCIYQWWTKLSNLKQAEPYFSYLSIDEQEIRKCFILSGPIVPKVPYTQNLSAKVDGSDMGGAVTLELGEDSTLTYSIDTGAVDDIEAHSDNPSMVEIHRSAEKSSFVLKPHLTGVTSVHLFSRHNDKLDIKTEVTIVEERI